MNRNKTARQHSFATVPSTQVPRSKFAMRQTRKQAFNASELVPVMVEEVLPGDVWQHTESIMARLATPIAPVVDDLDLETFYFFVPNRILTPIWEPFITGEDTTKNNPVLAPYLSGPGSSVVLNGVLDHMGISPGEYTIFGINAFPIWAYFTIYNEWFRDQNLQEEWEWNNESGNELTSSITNGTTTWDQKCLRAGKRSDYFTRSLPWPQKGNPVTLPLGTTAPILGLGTLEAPTTGPLVVMGPGSTMPSFAKYWDSVTGAAPKGIYVEEDPANPGHPYVRADLASATAATINSIRMASTIQQLLERDARGGSRYVENILAHWGVVAPNYMLQRPEYLGGSTIPITVNPVAQTAQYDAITDNASPLGNLGAEMHASGSKRTFTYAAVEHGFIIGLAVVRATPTYQQGLRKMWNRTTRLDYWDPLYAGLGEQAVSTEEIFKADDGVYTNPIWGYQERGAEYRYTPNEITGVLRSTAVNPMDWWHYAEEFATEPALNAAFIEDKTQETLARSLATAPDVQWSAQIIMDIQHNSNVARLMPAYSVPGIDRF